MIRALAVTLGAITGALVAVWLLGRYGERACDRLERQWRLSR